MKLNNSVVENTSLEDKITSLRAITFSVIFYIIGYAVKLSVLLSGVLQEVVRNEYLKLVTASFTGLALATGLLIVSVNERHKSIPYIIASLDAVALLLVFKIFDAKDWMEISTAIFISVFMAFVGYHLIDTFSAKYRQQKSQSLDDERLIEANTRLDIARESLKQFQDALRCKRCGIVHTSVSRYRNCNHALLKKEEVFVKLKSE